jgi:hypothetical protein
MKWRVSFREKVRGNRELVPGNKRHSSADTESF